MSHTHDSDRWQSTRAFLDASPTAFHAGAEIVRRLRDAGFEELQEGERWNLSAGQAYFVRRTFGAVAAVRMGTSPPADAGAVIGAAHTDSPALKLKTESERVVDGLVTVATEVYGGAIIGTWFDRDLEIAGAVTVQVDGAADSSAANSRAESGRAAGAAGTAPGPSADRATPGAAGATETRLVRLTDLTAVVPNVAIHLNRKVNEGFQYNKQDHLRCILGGGAKGGGAAATDGDGTGGAGGAGDSSVLRTAVAAQLGVAPDAILGMDLYLTDAAPARRLGQGGADSGDLYSARHIDNLAGCTTTLDAFMSSPATPWTQIAVFFDNEEVGSRTYAGAQSGFLDRLLDRLVVATGGTMEDAFRLRARSFLLSNDGAHAGHPNFHDKYDAAYLPRLGGGPVIKEHAGMSYTSRSDTAAHFRRACRAAEVPSQVFANRSDARSGSTIGPIIQTRSDLRSVDVGIPMLAMHSVRETAGVADLDLMTRAIAALYALGPE